MSILDPLKAGDAVIYCVGTERRRWWKIWQWFRPLRKWQIGVCLRCMRTFDEHGDAFVSRPSVAMDVVTDPKTSKYVACHHMRGGIGDGRI